jgi:hypothetical protein
VRLLQRCCPCLVAIFLLPMLLAQPLQAGTLQFFANGEEWARAGFVAPRLTRDGWQLTFRHIFVTLAGITAYQTDPPYDAYHAGPITASTRVLLPGSHTIDLVADADADGRVLIGAVDAPAGHYNALSWMMTPAATGAFAGSSMVLIGHASKGEQSVAFELVATEQSRYRCGEFVGDQRKGFVPSQGSADVEITFHLDHLFGRLDLPRDDHMNSTAPGFAPFAGTTGAQKISLTGLHIGHVGEGHCDVTWH